MERNLLWICKHRFVRSSVFLFNCSAYTSSHTHTKWGCQFTVRKQGGESGLSVYCCLVFSVRGVLLACLPASFSDYFFSSIFFPITVNSLHSGRDFGSCLSLWFIVILFLSGISLPSTWQKWSPSDLSLVPALSVRAPLCPVLRTAALDPKEHRLRAWEGGEWAQGNLKTASLLPRETHLPFSSLPSLSPTFAVRRGPAQEKLDILHSTATCPPLPPLPFPK